MTDRADHACAVDDCTKPLPHHVLMCRPHWRMVPRPVQRDVNSTWRRASRLRDQPLPDPARVQAVKDYLAARRAAVDIVNGKESRE
jgi:hypothetical protein